MSKRAVEQQTTMSSVRLMRFIRAFTLAAAASYGASAIVSAGPAAAETASKTFTTEGEHPFVVPAGVTSARVTLVGGAGGSGFGSAPGGAPATVTGTVAVIPGEVLYSEVAGNGQSASTEGTLLDDGGGGEGGIRLLADGGGQGGGASDVRTCPSGATPAQCGGQAPLASRLLVAGGGGGGGGDGYPGFPLGGAGGSADQPGFSGMPGASEPGGTGGQRGTLSGGGEPGAYTSVCEPSGEFCALAGQLGLGGHGGAGGVAGGGGGGGGGVFGGGGGGGGRYTGLSANGAGGGGGGGASSVPDNVPGVSDVSLVPTATGAEPSISITWTVPPPSVAQPPATVATGPPSALTPSAMMYPTTTPVPAISGLTTSPARFKRGRGPATIARAGGRGKAKKVPTSTTISFALSQPAAATLFFQASRPGVLARGKCTAPTKGRRKGRPCTRYVAVQGAVSRAAHAGTNRVRFQGLLDGGRSLAPGSYRLSLSAANAGGTSSAAQHPGFTLLP